MAITIIDTDMTETERAFGLGFLASGEFFLVINGPYLFDYALPMDKEKDNWNLFFYPGQARTWIGLANRIRQMDSIHVVADPLLPGRSAESPGTEYRLDDFGAGWHLGRPDSHSPRELRP